MPACSPGHRSVPVTLAASFARQSWLLEFSGNEARDERTRDEVARWLGPWADVPGAAGPIADGANLASFIAGEELPEVPAGVRRLPEGIGFRARDFDLSTRETGATVRAEVRFLEGSAIEMARLTLRILAMRTAFVRGAVALHAASVRTGGEALVFVGPSGSGKTSASLAFPEADRLDDDLVLLAREGGRWVRLDMFDKEDPSRFEPGRAGELPVRAILRPERGERFRLVPQAGGEALLASFHVPVFVCPPGEGRAVDEASSLLARLDRLVEGVPVARFEWALGEDLPLLLDRVV